MKHFTYIIFFIFYFFCGFIVAQQEQITLLNQQTKYVANERIILKFETENNQVYQLYCSNSYGSTVVQQNRKDDSIAFEIPSFISKKRGILNWVLLKDAEKILSGNLKIESISKSENLEMYLGPPSIEAGGLDFSMLVTIPTDSLDNPLEENTKVSIQKQFFNNIDTFTATVKNLISFYDIYSPIKTGRMLISTVHQEKNSAEFDINIVPAVPNEFTIYSKRNHAFADGNQMTTFYTSVLKDKYNNRVSDGTLVYFYIKNQENIILKTMGQTVNGIAEAKMIHPDSPAIWEINAFVEGMSQSNTIQLEYKQVIKDYTVAFTESNTKITIGPLQSFMNQMIPDGLTVSLQVLQKEKIVKEYQLESRKGYVNFIINPNFYEKGNYTIRIEAAGIVKTFENIKL